ncbi:SGNH/GDSL hydrolase family protein [Nocardia yamanashiensis]|uniref:SGNH/GDSL hydrolase family protein n=1 Tax=Nocardia yamanashiensis TaxID=209247 RepID=UPI002FCE267F
MSHTAIAATGTTAPATENPTLTPAGIDAPASAGALTEADDPMLLDDLTAAALLQYVPWRRFAVIGDSTAAGTGDSWPGYRDIPWADRVAHALATAHPGSAYLNTGQVGALIAEVRAGQLDALRDFAPDLVHISCGGNDLFRRDADLAQVERELDELCTLAASTGARLSMFTLADALRGKFIAFRPLFEGFAELVRRVAARHDAILTEFWAHPGAQRPDWLSADQIHLTMAGHAVVATEIIKSLAYRANSAH